MAPGLTFMRYACVECRKTALLPEKLTVAALVLAGILAIASAEPLFVACGMLAIAVPFHALRRNPLIAKERTTPVRPVETIATVNSDLRD